MIHYDSIDKTITNDRGRIVCTEFMVITCPSCRNETVQVCTTLDRTFYGHPAPNDTHTWCVVERGEENVVDAIMYARTTNPACPLIISSAVGLW